MFAKERNRSWYGTVVVAILVSLCSGCGGGSSMSSNSISPAQAQAVTSEFSQALAQALNNAVGVPTARAAVPSLAALVGDIGPDISGGCRVTSTGDSCDFPVSYSGPCPGGGAISVAGSVDGTLDNTGDGSVQTQLTVTPANCSVSNLVINGDPSVAVAGNINFTQSAPVFPITLTEIGGVSYGPNPSGACQFNVTYTIGSLTTCTISGTACGQPVSGNC